MKNTQLRRGNKVLHNGIEKTIDCISPGYVMLLEDRKRTDDFGQWVNLDEVEFIPLTEEWLLKFGLEKLDIDLYKIDNEYFILFFNETYYIADEDWKNKKRIIGKGLIYVHQLQNLYFALTGEELTLKP